MRGPRVEEGVLDCLQDTFGVSEDYYGERGWMEVKCFCCDNVFVDSKVVS